MSENVTSDPLEWGTSDVLSFLETIEGISSLSTITDNFKQQQIVGRDLLILNRDDLKHLGVTRVPDMRRILDAIDAIRNTTQNSLMDDEVIACLLENDIDTEEFRNGVLEMPTSDEAYWQRVEHTFILRLFLLRTVSEMATSSTLYPKQLPGTLHATSQVPVSQSGVNDTEKMQVLNRRRNTLEKLLQKIEPLLFLNLDETTTDSASDSPSSVLALARVAKEYQMTDSELDVLRFITTVKITKSPLLRSLLPSEDHAETPLVQDKCRCSLVQYVCCLSQLQMNCIMDDTRPLVRDRIIGQLDEDVLGSEFKFQVPDEVCRVLLGAPLSSEDRLKLAGTRLQNILDHESSLDSDSNRSLRSGSAKGTPEDEKKSTEKAIQEMLKDLAMEEPGTDNADVDSTGVASVNANDGVEEEGKLEQEINDREPRPYTCELDYLSDQLSMIMLQVQISNQRLERDLKQASLEAPSRWLRSDGGGKKQSIGELSAKHKLSQRKIEASLELTRKEGIFYPRLEELVAQLSLESFEKSVLLYLCGSMISPLFKSSIANESFRGSNTKCSVGDLLQVFCESVAEQVAARTYFYRRATMMEKGLIRISETYNASDLTDFEVQLDRRVLDCIVGLDKESTEVIQGSYLYDPTVDINSVILAPGLKEAIISSTANFDKFLRYRKQSSFDKIISYGVGLTLMFAGASGTGKTMMANALAAKVGKKLLLVDFPRLTEQATNYSSYQSVFREAELSNAILFFDECETLFMRRDSGGSSHLTELLTQMEQFEGICLLATNRPFDLDESMFRRISEVFEFKPPNHVERLEIWRVVTSHEAIPCENNIDWDAIALKYELTGGFIKNAVISALQLAVGRDPLSPRIAEIDIIEGCKKQMRGALQMVDFDERVVPMSGLDEIIVSDQLMGKLKAIVDIEKARSVLFHTWGFDDSMRDRQGTTALFWGPRGSGKQGAAAAIGFELGKPLKIVDLPQLLGKTGKANAAVVRECFKEARLMDAVLVLGGISNEGQRSASSAEDSRLLNLVVREMMRFPGVVVLLVDVTDSLELFVSRLEKGLLDGLKFTVSFGLPNRESREKLWEKFVQDTLPTRSLDFGELARASDELNCTQIGNAVYRGAASAALRATKSRFVTMEDLKAAIEEERQRGISAVERFMKSHYI